MKITKLLIALAAIAPLSHTLAQPIKSIITPYTISRVTTAEIDQKPYIVASSYEGTVVAYDFEGNLLWENPLSGYYNQDIYCDDLDGDGNDETLASNSDGTLYVLDKSGKELWSFRPSQAPMNSATIIRKAGKAYVAAGGYNNTLYYLDGKGELIETI